MIDKKTIWVFFFQISKILNGLVAIIFVPIFLTPYDQGLWFLMLSFGAILLLFSASQNSIALIFGAHEFRGLTLNGSQILGVQQDINSLYSYIKFSKLFFIKILSALATFTTVLFYFYIDEYNTFSLTTIFSIYILGLFFYGLNFSLLSYIESFNAVEYANRFKSLLISSIIVLCIYFLYNDYNLYALALSMSVSMVFWFIYFLFKFQNNIQNILSDKVHFSGHKKKIFLNYFKKNSFSMISGFLLFQIYTPVVYYFYGSEYSGKVGLSITVMTALFAISLTVLHAKLPYIIKLISNKNYEEAYKIYFNISKVSIAIFTLFLLLGLHLLFNVEFFSIYKNRVVELSPFIILSLAWFLQLIVYFLVTFIRIFKRELFVIPTIVSSIYILISTVIILKYFSVNYMFLGLLSSYSFGLPWIYIIYKNFLKGKIKCHI